MKLEDLKLKNCFLVFRKHEHDIIRNTRKMTNDFLLEPIQIHTSCSNDFYICLRRAEHLFDNELLPLLKKLFPEKTLKYKEEIFLLGPFKVCEINQIYDAVGVSGDNVCDLLDVDVIK